MRLILTVLISLVLSSCAPVEYEATESVLSVLSSGDWVSTCAKWDNWDKPGPPFQIHGNTYYVGTCGISAVLVAGAKGHVLIDGATEQGAAVIARNISLLGFEVSDVKILLHSHEHFDHVGGLAELQRLSNATLYASKGAKDVLMSGKSALSDPQHGTLDPFPVATVDQTLAHGELVQLGDISLRALSTPGHTKGALSWQWESCREGECEWIVYADSLSPISRPGYRFSDNADYLRAYKASLESLRQIDCTILVTPHPSSSQMRDRLKEGQFTNSNACTDYADAINKRLNKRLEKEAVER